MTERLDDSPYARGLKIQLSAEDSRALSGALQKLGTRDVIVQLQSEQPRAHSEERVFYLTLVPRRAVQRELDRATFTAHDESFAQVR